MSKENSRRILEEVIVELLPSQRGEIMKFALGQDITPYVRTNCSSIEVAFDIVQVAVERDKVRDLLRALLKESPAIIADIDPNSDFTQGVSTSLPKDSEIVPLNSNQENLAQAFFRLLPSQKCEIMRNMRLDNGKRRGILTIEDACNIVEFLVTQSRVSSLYEEILKLTSGDYMKGIDKEKL